MRILCLIPNMGTGGAERVMSYLVAHFADRNEVTLMTWERPGEASFYALPPSVRRIQANRLGGRGLTWLARVASRPLAIRREIRRIQPNIVISFMDMMNVTTIVACFGIGVPVIVSERNDPSANLDATRRFLRNRFYSFASLIVVPTGSVAKNLPLSLRSRIRIVANPIPAAAVAATPDQPGPGRRFRIVAVGRLVLQKGHRTLIEAFGHIALRHPNWDLVIAGDGPERKALEEEIGRLGLDGRVRLPGVTTDIAALLASAHLMAFPSYYEGFPNALAEGLAASLPAVGNAGVSGVEELIVNGETGILTDPAAGARGLAGALSQLICDAPLRSRMGKAARSHVAQWAPVHVFRKWEDVLAEAIARHPSLRRK